MKVLLLLALFLAVVTPVTAVLGRRVLGQPVTEDVERRLKKMFNDRRMALTGNRRLASIPEFRRLSEPAPILSRPRNKRNNRKLPYVTDDEYSDHTAEPTEPEEEEYSDDDHYYGKGKGKGKGGMMGGMMMGSKGKGGMMMGMMSGKGKGHHSGKGGLYPSYDDFTLVDDLYYDDYYFETDDCQMITFNETFSIPGPTLFIAPDTSDAEPGTATFPGTVFVTERVNLLELDGVTPIVGSTVSGVCTRTTIGDDGGGVCQFVFIDDEGFTVSVDGFLPGPLGGPMAVTGGTGELVGVFGQLDFFPIFSDTDPDATGDIFIDVIEYQIIADLGTIVCPN